MKFFCLVFLFLFSFTSFSQFLKKTDSLETVLKAGEEDTGKVTVLRLLAEEFQSDDPDRAIHYAEKMIALSEKLSFPAGMARAYKIIAWSYTNKGKYDLAITYNLKALKINEQIGDKKAASAVYTTLGGVYYYMANYDKALENWQRSISIDEELKDTTGIAKGLNNIGLVYQKLGKYSMALNNFEKAEKMIRKQGKNNSFYASVLNNIANVYDYLRIYEKAINYYSQSLEIKKAINDKKGMSFTLLNIAHIFYMRKNYSESIKYINEGLSISKQIKNAERIREAYSQYAEVYSAMGNYEKAYKYKCLAADLQDSLVNVKMTEQIAEMDAKYQTEKKEQQIALLNKDKELLHKDKELQNATINRQKIVIWSVVCGLFIVVLLSVFIFRERRKSEKLLLNILPKETARELKQKGKATARHYESVTVMFTDFKGFTQIAEKLSAEELVRELDFIFRKFDEIISKYQIEKIKTIGDAYMCASGLPTPNTNHAEQIVKAALDIQQWMKENHNGRWNIRIGIHSGPVTAGVVGDKKFAYDIWGDTVNTASRMESSGEAGKVNISGATYELIKDKFACTFRGKIPARNKGEIEMYFVERV